MSQAPLSAFLVLERPAITLSYSEFPSLIGTPYAVLALSPEQMDFGKLTVAVKTTMEMFKCENIFFKNTHPKIWLLKIDFRVRRKREEERDRERERKNKQTSM